MATDWQLQANGCEDVPTNHFTVQEDLTPNEHQLNVVEPPPVTSNKHLMIVHGWGNTAADMVRWLNAIKDTGAFTDRYLWNIQYDYRKRFPVCATNILQSLQEPIQAGHEFKDVILIGYSMGGLVVRQMAALGFPVTRLLSICSPHQGLRYGQFFPPIDPGVASLKQGSHQLRALNNDPKEAALRDRYMFVAVQYQHKDVLGQWVHHDDDTIVDGDSARGDALGAGIRRQNVCLSYEGGIGVRIGVPHMEAMNPAWFGQAIDFLKG